MPKIDIEKQVIVLFDEHGTPTFRPDRETDCFLGVTVTYNLTNEKEIFNSCSKLFGLSNTKPLKNRHIKNERAEQIANLAINLPIQIVVRSVNLDNEEFKQSLTIYEQWGNELREKYKLAGERNIAQILYSQILVETVFTSIINYLERHMFNSIISIYVDHHSFPKDVIEILLKYWAQRIQTDLNSFYRKQGPNINVRTTPILLMKNDSSRKRFVDVITSAVSRYFFHKNNLRFSRVPLKILLKNNTNHHQDITQKTIDFIKQFMDYFSRNPPVNNWGQLSKIFS